MDLCMSCLQKHMNPARQLFIIDDYLFHRTVGARVRVKMIDQAGNEIGERSKSGAINQAVMLDLDTVEAILQYINKKGA